MRLLLVVQLMWMHQNVTHSLNGPVSIIPSVSYHAPTRNVFVRITSSTKSNPGITITAVVLPVSSDTNSCPRVATAGSLNVKPLYVGANLQGSFRANQILPCIKTQWGGTMLPISNQWVQRVHLLIDFSELDSTANLHTNTDLGEGCVPVSR